MDEPLFTFPSVTETIELPATHPYLYFGPDDLPRIREMCLGGSHTDVYRQKLEELETALDEPFPVPPPREQCYRDGIWESYSQLSQQARGLVTNYAIACLVKERPEFLEKVWEGLTSIMRWPSWVHPVHEFQLLDLDGSHTNETVATVYDLLYDRFTDNQRKELEFAIHARGLSLCVGGMDDFGWATMYKSNWCSVCVSNMGMTALAMLRSGHWDREDLLPVIQECAERLTRFLDAIESDGSWKEGPGYWYYGIRTALPFCDALRRLTGGRIDLFDHPRLKRTVEYPINCYLPPDRVVNFADAPDEFPGGGLRGGLTFRKLAQEYEHTGAAYIDRLTTGGSPSLEPAELLWDASSVPSERPAPKHPSHYFPDAGWCTMRSSWEDPDAHVLALKIGSTQEHHGHADVGGYIIHTHGRALIRELGIGRYGDPRGEIFRETSGHNLPLFDRIGQPRDRRLVGTVQDSAFTAEHDYLRADIAPAYGLDKLTGFVRHFLFLRPDTFVVVDEFEVAETTHMSSRIHYLGECRFSGRTASVLYGTGSVDVSLLTPESSVFSQGTHRDLKPMRGDPERREVSYLEVVLDLNPGRTVIAVAFSCGKEPEDVRLDVSDREFSISAGSRTFSAECSIRSD